MYKIKNGILEKDNKKIFALGESYYPSFHPAKYPVPPEGDRIGEMKKDFAMMKEMGFNHIRIAAIGTTKMMEDGRLVIDTPFVDEMIEEAEKLDISISIRLQGFSVNLRDFKDVLMRDADGNEQDTTVWLDFIQTTMNHKGILEDNRFYSGELSSKYEKFPNVVGLQIYNEPHFPGKTVFDYHPSAIEAYRKWLVENNIMTEAEAETYAPPKKRDEQTIEMWANWRKFSQESLTKFLNNSADGSKDKSTLPTFTCCTPCQLFASSPFRGVDIFGNARSSMDIVGFTCYYHASGAEYYAMGLFLDLVASAAMYEKKESWCIELDSRTYIPQNIFNKNTYAALGSGIKGLVYYQWRGDHPSPATPIPNGCGLLNYDGSKTHNFDNADRMVKFINKMSDYLVNAKRTDERITIFHSDYAIFMSDASENTTELRDDKNISNSYLAAYKEIYRDLRRKNYNVNIADCEALRNNFDKIDVLFIPKSVLLSDAEKSVVDEFVKQGGRAFESTALITDVNVGGGYLPYGENIGVYTTYYTIDELCDEFLPAPFVKCNNPMIGVQSLTGDNYKLIVLTNTAISGKSQNAEIYCNQTVGSATLCVPGKEEKLKVDGCKITVENLTDGAIVIVR